MRPAPPFLRRPRGPTAPAGGPPGIYPGGMTETATTPGRTADHEQIAALHLRWMNALVRGEGDPNLDFRTDDSDLYDFDGSDVVLYDDFDPERRVARSADEYAAIWEPVFAGVHTPRHSVSDGPH